MMTKVTRIRDEYHTKLQKLAALIQKERGLRRADLGLAAEAAIEEALQRREEARYITSKKEPTRNQA